MTDYTTLWQRSMGRFQVEMQFGITIVGQLIKNETEWAFSVSLQSSTRDFDSLASYIEELHTAYRIMSSLYDVSNYKDWNMLRKLHSIRVTTSDSHSMTRLIFNEE